LQQHSTLLVFSLDNVCNLIFTEHLSIALDHDVYSQRRCNHDTHIRDSVDIRHLLDFDLDAHLTQGCEGILFQLSAFRTADTQNLDFHNSLLSVNRFLFGNITNNPTSVKIS
jgi:hypothetical protein